MTDIKDFESRLNSIEVNIRQLKETPSEKVMDKLSSILIQKLEDRDKIIDLELKNMSQSIKLDIKESLENAHINLEKKIDGKITEAIRNQKEKVSWGLELLRFAIVAILFLFSIKMVV